MDRDLRQTPVYRDVETFIKELLEPAFGTVSYLSGPRVSPDGTLVACTGARLDALEGPSLGQARVCVAPADGSGLRQLTGGPNDDAGPQWSPDGSTLTFLSDRAAAGRFQLYALETAVLGEARLVTTVDGVVEHHQWSPDGSTILMVVAGTNAEQADALGSGTLGGQDPGAAPAPPWLPEVESSDDVDERRALWLVDAGTGEARSIGRQDLNIWEASWCGTDLIVAVAGSGTDEGAWYDAPLVRIDPTTGADRVLTSSDVQLGWAQGSPDGREVAVIEAVCSDRYVVAGQLLLVDPASGARRPIDTAGVDVSWSEWRGPGRLFAIGLRGLDTVALEVDTASGDVRETWVWAEGCGDFSPFASPIGTGDAFAAVVGGATRPTTLTRVEAGADQPLATIAHAGNERMWSAIAARERLTWTAPDGLEIEGFITLPATGTAPYPTIAQVHGGPISATTDHPVGAWSGALLDRGYAIFQPNPRGSSGRGREFAARVIGDMGGGDARDILSGLDHLVERGLADPDRIGVMGGSYGGFMAAWLPTVDGRFQAAVSASPVTDWYSERFDSTLGSWAADYVGGEPLDVPEAYVRQSPVLAKDLTTPTLLTAGLHDRATPVGQATEFYRALRGRGVPAEVVRYPQEGHGVRNFPALIDFVARSVGWFERFMPPGR
jgi:dipeptidyl aminopeptidase/acylaminoacyl peptidase